MSQCRVKKFIKGLAGEITIPSDKSISHRAVMLASMAKGKSIIKNFSHGQDPYSTLKVCKSLGIEVEFNDDLIIKSTGKLIAPTCASCLGFWLHKILIQLKLEMKVFQNVR